MGFLLGAGVASVAVFCAARAVSGEAGNWVGQYAQFLGRFARGEWGMGSAESEAIRRQVGGALVATFELVVVALVLAIVGGVLLIVVSRVFGHSAPRRTARTLGTIGLTVPVFLAGIALLAMADWAARLAGWEAVVESLRVLLLPGMALALFPAALVTGGLEARLAEPRIRVLKRALRARGYGPVRILGWHLPRVLAAPLVRLLATRAGGLLGGALVIEVVFGRPGLGPLLVEAALERQLFVIEHGLLALMLIGLALVALGDVLATVLLPLRHGREGR